MLRFIVMILSYSLLLLGCSNTDKLRENVDKEQVVADFVSTLDHAQLISIIIIENDFDYSKISEVLNCSSFVLKRISNRTTNLNEKSEVFIRSLLEDMLLQPEKNKYFDKKNVIQKRIQKELGVKYLIQKKMKSFEIIIDEQWEEVAVAE